MAQQRQQRIIDALHAVALEENRAFDLDAERCAREAAAQRAHIKKVVDITPRMPPDAKRAA